MKKSIKHSLMALSTIAFLTGCGGSGNGSGGNGGSGDLPSNVQSAIDGPLSTLSQESKDTLSYMGNEERLAYDVYNKLYEEWGIKQFNNIATKSEIKHITAVQELVKKYSLNDGASFTNIDSTPLGYANTPIANMDAGTYDISKIQGLYDDLISQGMASQEAAFKVGCKVEVVDVTDLDEYIAVAEKDNASDVTTVFNFLRDGSYNHYWAFDKGLKDIGIINGCCTWSDLCKDYPQN